ncbi:MAG TPA: hemerythrin family protein [Anaeromyxobacteraceae bacterium]|jgi:hemerythrin
MMIGWDPSLAVGHTEIDAQHQELFRRVDRLLEAIQFGLPRAEVEGTMAFLGAYVHEHFGAEETLMLAHGYPRLAEHRAQHAGFVRAFSTIFAELERAGPSPELAARLGAALVDWLREHVAGDDRALGVWLAAQEGGGGRTP